MYLDDDASYLGGLNINELLFNWHPVLMVTGLIFCSATALVSFKVIPMDHNTKKYVHATLHTVAVVCIVLGITAVFQGFAITKTKLLNCICVSGEQINGVEELL